MTLLKRRKPEPMGVRESGVIRCPAHLQFVRGFVCSIYGKHECDGKSEAAHVRTGTDGGTGMKPGDNWAIPLCGGAHREQHQIGEPAFERRYGIDMKAIARRLWGLSKAGARYRREQEQRRA